MTSPHERVTVSDALQFISARTGYHFERRTFLRWCESGAIEVGEQLIEIETQKVGGLWYITRQSIERVISTLQPEHNS